MKRHLTLCAAYISLMFAAPYVQAGDYVSTTIQKTTDYYSWVTTLSSGEKILTGLTEEDFRRLGKKAIAARQFRVAVTTSEIYSTVYLEEITEGWEGCCRKVASIRQLDLNDMQKKFRFRGELAGFEVVRWTGPTSFKFRIHDRTFELSGLDKNRIYIEEEKQ